MRVQFVGRNAKNDATQHWPQLRTSARLTLSIEQIAIAFELIRRDSLQLEQFQLDSAYLLVS